jgi:nucleoside-diphosphate-sugar epimerase
MIDPSNLRNGRTLVSGTSSGLGRYLLEELDGTPFRRDQPGELDTHRRRGYACVIHCATDARNSLRDTDLTGYCRSHVDLTRDLISIPCERFVYASSVAVYPDPSRENRESDTIVLTETASVYGLFKLIAERIVLERHRAPIALRCSSIVGRTSRPNNVIRALCSPRATLALTADSRYNLVSSRQILEFIGRSMEQGILGIFNTGASCDATLEEIAGLAGTAPTFGTHRYEVPRFTNEKIRAADPGFARTTLQVAAEVISELRGTRP